MPDECIVQTLHSIPAGVGSEAPRGREIVRLKNLMAIIKSPVLYRDRGMGIEDLVSSI
jgi:hypothetical protein